MCCQPQRSGLLRSLPCRGDRHAGYSFPSLFRNTLDSHRYLDLKDWPAISTSMSLRLPFSEGGARWIAKGQRQRRPYASFYCVLLRPSRTRFAQLKSRHRASKTNLNAAFYFPPSERNAGLADCSLAPSFIISAAGMAYVAPALA
jgi:hypothetical protein